MINLPIKLVKDTITNCEIDSLCSWLSTYPQLTKGKLTEEFEQEWSKWLGVKYSVFVNSGSAANLGMFYALKVSNRLKNNKIVAPCVSWVTTVSPIMQLGFELILCDTDKDTLGLDPIELENICKLHNPACLILVHVLGFPNKMKEIREICNKYDVIIIEDSCESVGSEYENKKTGTFGLMSSFSTYFGHHFSTIEGGLISTNDFELYEILKSIRSHGWSRDLSPTTQDELKKKYNIDDFRNLYTFYYPGFNMRSTDLQSFLGLGQIKTLNDKNQKRYKNFIRYHNTIKNNYWKIKFEGFISNFSYPIVHPKKNIIVEKLKDAKVECRPLVCGSMSRQPFYYERYGEKMYSFSDIIHDFGLYIPNNPDMNDEEIDYICDIINSVTNQGETYE
jgi:CDP-6-deoxy-D-xylo-4-hexulose-3-dehydrase